MALPRVEVEITADTRQAEAGFDRVERGMRQVGDTSAKTSSRVGRMSRRLSNTTSRSRNMANGFRNLGFQINDFATQVGAGTRASVALGQQLPQLLQGFGMLGIALSVVAAVGIPVARVLGDMNTEGLELTRVFGTVAPLMTGVADAFSTVKEVAIDFAEIVINNLDRIVITAGVVASIFAGRWIAAFVAARIATFSLAGALTFLRGALIRTGVGALVVGIGELIYQFTRLVSATDNFASALALLKDVATEVWSRIADGAEALVAALSSVWLNIKADFVSMIADMQEAWANFLWSMGSGLAKMPGMEGLANSIMDASNNVLQSAVGSGGARATARGMRGEAQSESERASGLFSGLGGTLESVTAIRDLLAGMKEDRITLPDILGVNTGDDEEGGGGKGGKTKAEEQIDAQTSALEMLREQGRATYGALGAFVQQFAGKSKAAAVAALAIQKGLSIAQIITNTAAAQMRALAELGPIAGPPVAAKIGLLGKAQAALVAATGLSQATGGAGGASGGGGGGVGGIGRGANNVQVQRVDLNIIGGNDRDRMVAQEVISVLNNAQRDGFRLDPRLIGGT